MRILCFGLEFARLTSSTVDCTNPSCPKQLSSGIFCIKNYPLACSQRICICAFRHSVLCPVIVIAILLALEMSSRFLDRWSAKRSSEIEVDDAHKDLKPSINSGFRHSQLFNNAWKPSLRWQRWRWTEDPDPEDLWGLEISSEFHLHNNASLKQS